MSDGNPLGLPSDPDEARAEMVRRIAAADRSAANYKNVHWLERQHGRRPL